jgi:hypothetical protein
LRGARFLAYLSDMSQSLRAVRLATFFNKLPGHSTSPKLLAGNGYLPE